MSLNRKPITSRNIMELCGAAAYKKGEEFYHADRIQDLTYQPDTMEYAAVVKGNKKFTVNVSMDPFGEIEASCTCASFQNYFTNCEHIAGVLCEIMDVERKLANASQQVAKSEDLGVDIEKARQLQLHMLESRAREEKYRQTDAFLTLFQGEIVRDQRKYQLITGDQEQLHVEFICRAVSDYLRPSVLTLEMRIGPKKVYVVPNIKSFLQHVDEREPHEFTKMFTYDPELHGFRPEDQEVIDILLDIYRNEWIVLESWGQTSAYTSFNHDRELLIPPAQWEHLLKKLVQANTQFCQNDRNCGPLTIREDNERLPLIFQFQEAREDGYQLDIYGFNDLMILDHYGYCVIEGQLYRLQGKEENRIADMRRIFHNVPHLLISHEQMEPFMERVLPSLQQIGQVRITEEIQSRLTMHPLKTKVYLDRNLQEHLLVRLEYGYGNIVIPLTPEGAKSPQEIGVILIRDSEKEALIAALMNTIASRPYKDRYLFEHEEDVYHFLYHVLPQLERHCEVYATAAIQEVMYTPSQASSGPKASVNMKGDRSWLEVGFSMEGLDRKEIEQLVHAIMEKKKYYRLPTGAFVSLEQEEFQEFGMLLTQLGVKKSDVKGPQIAVPVLRGLQLEDQGEHLKGIKFGKEFRQLMDHLRHPEALEFEVPVSLAPILREYQQYGFQWMKTLAHYRFGGILADDMGLGKTLQSITFILSEHQKAESERMPTLIVCPASLVFNWERECRKFAPELKVSVVIGDKQERTERIEALFPNSPNYRLKPDVLITSYPLLRRDIEQYEQLTFGAVFLDEAQAFKNHASQTSQSVKQLRAERRFALTGTPIENSLEELWSIFDAIFPELFTSKKVFHELHHEQVAKMVRPFILRRMKRDVLTELPEKIETLQTTELYPEQKRLYAAYLEKLRKQASKELVEEGFPKSRMKILAGLTRLRQLCCHPALFVEDYEGSSSKMEQLFEIIEECMGSGRRMLIFSQFTGMLDIIRNTLAQMGLPCFYLAGDTPVDERLEMCSRFNEGEHNIFLISLKAGGTGLNLTGADTVILYDLWWNPAVEQQAADRAHRMGQKNVVQVIRLITQGTVEEKMYELQQKKKDLIDAVIQTGEGATTSLTEEDIRELLMI